MHIVVAIVYAVATWLTLLAVTLFVGGFWFVAAAGPFIISGMIISLMGVDMLATWILSRLRPKPAPETRHREQMTI